MGRAIEPDSASERESRLDWHLLNWRAWMRRGELVRAMPRKSVGFASGNSQSFDEMCEQCDSRSAAAIDALIRSLSPVEQAALMHRYLHAVWRFNRESIDDILARARAKLTAGMEARGIY